MVNLMAEKRRISYKRTVSRIVFLKTNEKFRISSVKCRISFEKIVQFHEKRK